MAESTFGLDSVEAINWTNRPSNRQAGEVKKSAGFPLSIVESHEYCSFDLQNFSQGPQFRGCVERIDQSCIGGWCIDTHGFSNQIYLKVLFHGIVIGETAALQSRPDVQAVVGQPCMPGFNFPLQNCRITVQELEIVRPFAEVNLEAPAVLDIMIAEDGVLLPRIGQGSYGLTNGAVLKILHHLVVKDGDAAVERGAGNDPSPQCSALLDDIVLGVASPNGSVLRGALERVDEEGVVGWCFDPFALTKHVALKLVFLGIELRQFLANMPRGDVENAVGHSCAPGFAAQWSSVSLTPEIARILFARVMQDPQSPAAVAVLTVEEGIRVEQIVECSIRMTNIELFSMLMASSLATGGDTTFLDEFLDVFMRNEALFHEDWAIFRRLFSTGSLVWKASDAADGEVGASNAIIDYIKGRCVLHGPLFDDRHYVYLNSDAAASCFPPLLHYILYGRKRQLQPHLLFVPKSLDQQPVPRADLAYLDFLERRTAEDWYPLIDIVALRAEARYNSVKNADILVSLHKGEISPISLFDVDFYKKSCELNGISLDQAPVYHYMMEGWKLGIDPHPLFDAKYYLVDQRSVDKIYSQTDPLTMFVQSNDQSRFSPSPFIDLMHLRHLMCMGGYVYTGDARLIIDALKKDWISTHPHLQEAMIGFLMQADEVAVLKKPLTTMNDLHTLVGAIRLGELPDHKAGPDVPSISAAVQPAMAEGETLLSIIILNYNKPIYTLLSAYSAWVAVAGSNSEVLVVDNGSSPFFVELLYRYLARLPGVRVISNRKNLFFGEGNNVALDVAIGNYILFLNNDAVVRRETLERLVGAMEQDKDIGLLAPVLLLPDRRVQESGGIISGCGQVIQESKFVSFEDFHRIFSKRDQVRVCDYASAACCLLRKEVARKVLGFDMLFEPFYFEDTDFCVRVRAQGYRVAVHRGAFAFHFENASTSEFLGRSMLEVIDRQKTKFRKRWFGVFEEGGLALPAEATTRYAAASRYEVLTPLDVRPGYSGKPVAWVYSPYEIRVGGGERYILSLTQVLSNIFEVWFLTPNNVSRARLAMTMDDLAIRPGRFHTATLEDTANWPRPELYVSMGNEIEPPSPGFGRRNIFHCQYPFPLHHTGPFSIKRIHGYDAVVVNSRYTAGAVEKLLKVYNVAPRPVYVLSPPVPVPSEEQQARILSEKPWDTEKALAVNIGRFMAGGHNKRQDIVLHLAERAQNEKLPVNFELYGGLNSSADDQAFFAGLVEQATRIKAQLRMNAARSEIETALTNALLYVHPCGMGCYPGFKPEQVEHFGITVVEAMGYGAFPLVYKWGGPAEIVSETGVGATFETMEDAYGKLKEQLARPAEERRSRMVQAMKQSQRYSEANFQATMLKIVEAVALAR
ncbi:glycosyltransferase [Azospirillum sp. Marseille-Q6669]